MDKQNQTIRDKYHNLEVEEYVQNGIFLNLCRKYREKIIAKTQYLLKINDLVMLISSIIGVIFAVVAAENSITFIVDKNLDRYLSKIKISFDQSSPNVTGFRAIVTISTIIIMICIIIHYSLFLKLGKFKLNLQLKENIITSGYYKYALIEMLLNIIHTPPYFEGYVDVAQRSGNSTTTVNTDIILTVLMMFTRSYIFLKFLAMHSYWSSFKIQKICLSANTRVDYLFSLKAEFKINPFRLVFTTMGISVFYFGYALRCIEMFFMNGSDNDLDWRHITNGVWCIIITISTVGFGDFYPSSTLGRILVVISCFWGTFLISLMMAALTMTLQFNTQEERAYQSITSTEFELEYCKISTILLQRSVRYFFHVKTALDENLDKNIVFRIKKSKLFWDLKEIIEKFRHHKIRKSEINESISIVRSLEKIENNINVEMARIIEEISILEEVKLMLEEFDINQKIIKNKTKTLHGELEELNNKVEILKKDCDLQS